MQRLLDSASPGERATGKPTDFVSEDKSKVSAVSSRARLRLFLILTALIITLDQLSKLWINANRPQTMLVPGFLDLVYVRNNGAVFGLFHNHVVIFIVLSIIASIAILVLLYYFPPVTNVGAIAFALIFSGIVGNLIDRIRLGYVIDFVAFHVHELFHWPAFNVADAALVVGVFTLIYYFYRWGVSRKSHERGLKPQS
jgi:signal peptidase II